MILPQTHHTCSSSSPASNRYKPVVGILTHPRRLSDGTIIPGSTIRTSYVKFVKYAGARAIHLIYNEPHQNLLKKLDLVNGVLLTGGWAINHAQYVKNEKSVEIDKYFKTVELIFKKVLERNDDGDYFPLYGICLGFEHITKIVSEDNNILEKFKALDQPSTLDFEEDAVIKGSILEWFPPDLRDKLRTDRIVMQHHCHGISPNKFLSNPKLSSFFNILTTSKDEDDKEYVSTMQSCEYPITLFQWHPEKNAFEWGSEHIPHTEDAKRVTQFTASFLVSEASKSSKRPVAEELNQLMAYLISDDRDAFGGKAEEGFIELYIF